MKILVVGSFVMDQIASTEVFPCEGQTVLGTGFHKAPGGKGANQAVQAARLGAAVTMVGKLGRDTNGQEMLAVCKKANICVDHVAFDDEAASGCAVIILEEAPEKSTRNRIIVIPGANMRLVPDDVAFLRDAIRQYDMVMLQLEIPMEINELVARIAHENGIPVMLNPAPSAPLSDDLLSRLTFLSPNEHEAEDLTGIHIRHTNLEANLEDAKKAADILLQKGVKNVLITLGSAGAALFNSEGVFYAPSVPGVTAVDPTAAGDSFIGAFCCGYCCKWDWDSILRFANHTAAITVSHMGAMPSLPMLSQVEAYFASQQAVLPDISILRG